MKPPLCLTGGAVWRGQLQHPAGRAGYQGARLAQAGSARLATAAGGAGGGRRRPATGTGTQAMLEETRALNHNMANALKQQENLMLAVLVMQNRCAPPWIPWAVRWKCWKPLPGAVNELKVVHEESMLRPPAPPPIWRSFRKNIVAVCAVQQHRRHLRQQGQQRLAAVCRCLRQNPGQTPGRGTGIAGGIPRNLCRATEQRGPGDDTARRKLATTLNGLTYIWTTSARPPKPI